MALLIWDVVHASIQFVQWRQGVAPEKASCCGLTLELAVQSHSTLAGNQCGRWQWLGSPIQRHPATPSHVADIGLSIIPL